MKLNPRLHVRSISVAAFLSVYERQADSRKTLDEADWNHVYETSGRS